MIPAPPRPTLFPYTTLFRSPPRFRVRSRTCTSRRWGCRAAPSAGDRKSTRLNSSHQIISYAVFCLKKKSVATDVLEHRRQRQGPLARRDGVPAMGGVDELGG